MREIKFRAWNKRNKWFDDEFLIAANGEIMQPVEVTYNTPNQEIEQAYDELIVEQFTGLKDSNGVEIYCGDIVKLKGLAKGKQTGAVIYSDTACKFAVRVYRNGYRKNEPHLVALRGCTVIGNVHQNPELLEN